MSKKNCALPPAAGRRTQFFHNIFTEPGKVILVHPCIAHSLLSILPKVKVQSVAVVSALG